jgi:hypothetical protein
MACTLAYWHTVFDRKLSAYKRSFKSLPVDTSYYFEVNTHTTSAKPLMTKRREPNK